jgi:hypothetical protein
MMCSTAVVEVCAVVERGNGHCLLDTHALCFVLVLHTRNEPSPYVHCQQATVFSRFILSSNHSSFSTIQLVIRGIVRWSRSGR